MEVNGYGHGKSNKKLNDLVMRVKAPTDLEIFIECYRRFGIECKVREVNGTIGTENGSSADSKLFTIILENNRRHDTVDAITTITDKVVGNAYTKLVFSNEGKFIEQGIWE